MQKEDFKVGQTVYLLELRFTEFDYHRIERRIREVKVLCVGRKYITVDYCGGIRFDMTNEFREVTDYSPTYSLYLSKEEIQRELKRKATINEINTKIIYNNSLLRRMTDDELQTMLTIIRKYVR